MIVAFTYVFFPPSDTENLASPVPNVRPTGGPCSLCSSAKRSSFVNRST